MTRIGYLLIRVILEIPVLSLFSQNLSAISLEGHRNIAGGIIGKIREAGLRSQIVHFRERSQAFCAGFCGDVSLGGAKHLIADHELLDRC